MPFKRQCETSTQFARERIYCPNSVRLVCFIFLHSHLHYPVVLAGCFFFFTMPRGTQLPSSDKGAMVTLRDSGMSQACTMLQPCHFDRRAEKNFPTDLETHRPQYIKTFYESMPWHIAAVIQAQGSHFNVECNDRSYLSVFCQ